MPTAPTAARRTGPPGKRSKAAPDWRGVTPLEILVGGVVVAIFSYELLFNLLPSGIRVAIAAGLAGGIVLLSLASILAKPRIWRIILFALLLVVAGCWLMGEAGGKGRLDFVTGIRFLMPLFFALWVIEYRRAINPRLVFFLACGTLVIATLSSILRPQEVIGSVLRLPPFTGGEDGAHASAYIVALCALLIHQLWLNKAIPPRMAVAFLAIAVVLLMGIRVATPMFMLLNYGLLHILLTKRLATGTKFLLWFAMLASLVAVLSWHETLQEDVRGGEAETVENLGSGRVGTWLGRIDLLSRRDLPTLAFGSGPGSDNFYSRIWWWEKKDSHHDLLTIIIESGLIGLLAVFFFLFLLFHRLGREGPPLIWFLLSGSLISNALLQRPIIATLFWLAVALAALRVDQRMKARWRERNFLLGRRRRHPSTKDEGNARRRPMARPGAP